MIRRVIAPTAALLCVLAAGLCLPALGAASSGGGAVAAAPGASAIDLTAPGVQPGNMPVTASGDGMTIATHASALLRHGLLVTGSLSSGAVGKTVEIELRGAKTNWTWQPIIHTQVRRDGAFSGVWQTNHIGQFALRGVVQQPGHAAAGLPTVTIVVYRPSVATLYGPGFWGSRTACGQILRRGTLGLANRTLPCGTRVALYYHGRTMIVPVIDRGPYANGADWDLTMATGKALGIDSTVTLGAVSLPRAR